MAKKPKNTKEQKPPEGTNMKRMLPFKLNDEDKARKGEIAAELNKQLEAAVEVKKSEMKKHNEKCATLTKRITIQLKMIQTGIERREVPCVEVKNYEKDVVEYHYNNEVLESLPMKPEDRQQEMKIAPDPKETKNGKEKWQKLAPKYKPKGDEEAPTREQEIASVHKLETSRKGASSAVDPK